MGLYNCQFLLLPVEILAAKEKHGLKAEAMRELGNVQYSVRNVRCADGILQTCRLCFLLQLKPNDMITNFFSILWCGNSDLIKTK